jgi:hypothetical protein
MPPDAPPGPAIIEVPPPLPQQLPPTEPPIPTRA